MAWQTSAGGKLSIATTPGAPATHDEAGYGAKTFTEIGEITNIGQFGREYALVTHQPLSTRGVKKGKGSYNNGTLNPTVAFDPDDAGQELLQEALDSDESWGFEVEAQNGHKFYLMGRVMSFPITIGTVDDVVTCDVTIEIDSDEIVSVPAPI